MGGKKATPRWDDLREEIFDAPSAVELVQRYFASHASGPAFTGSLFNTWAGGGELHPDVVTSDDLIAVQFLSMRPFSETIWRILEGQRREISAALSRIPQDATLWGPPARVDADLAHAAAAWEILRAIPGAGWVTAGKILARKRPNLVPVYDSVVRGVVGGGDAYWMSLRSWLGQRPSAGGCTNVDQLRAIRAEAGISADRLPDLRVLDVVLWMTGRHKAPKEVLLERDADEDDPHLQYPGLGPRAVRGQG